MSMRGTLLRICKRILMLVYDDEGLINHYAGELAQLVDTDFFSNGELLGMIQISPHPDEGYNLEFFTKEEVEIDGGTT